MNNKLLGTVSAGILMVGAAGFEQGASAAPMGDEICTHTVVGGETMSDISAAIPTINLVELIAENPQIPDPDRIEPGMVLDTCVGDAPSVAPGLPPSEATPSDAVFAQQSHLNSLLEPYLMPALALDGRSGPRTERAICAAELLLDMVPLRDDLVPGSAEEAQVMAATALTIPDNDGNQRFLPQAPNWFLADKTCEVGVFGQNNVIVQIMPISTGTGVPDPEGHSTYTRNGFDYAFRYIPAATAPVAGWHNNSTSPVEGMSVHEGDIYKPIYYDRGQAIFGATEVSLEPSSSGGIRVDVANQDNIVNLLGLGLETNDVWGTDRLNFVVVIQGNHVPDTD